MVIDCEDLRVDFCHYQPNIECEKSPMFKNFRRCLMACSIFQNQQRSNGSGGPTQRASALAALNSAFSSPSPPKATSATRPAGTSSASQRAAAIAALSGVLTAEKKQSSEGGSPVRSNRSSPVRSSRSSPVRSADSGPAGIKIFFALPLATSFRCILHLCVF